VDPITLEVVRDENGLCVIAKAGDTGELVGKIVENDPISQFCGYVSQEDTKKKVIENVFKFGDKAFLSGDLMEMDDNGFLKFKDRTGDTFRWKG
jgi:solute carrier family 27 fatty acid transporter 1/4